MSGRNRLLKGVSRHQYRHRERQATCRSSVPVALVASAGSLQAQQSRPHCRVGDEAGVSDSGGGQLCWAQMRGAPLVLDTQMKPAIRSFMPVGSAGRGPGVRADAQPSTDAGFLRPRTVRGRLSVACPPERSQDPFARRRSCAPCLRSVHSGLCRRAHAVRSDSYGGDHALSQRAVPVRQRA